MSNVVPIAGEPTRFHVSGTEHPWYLVDLAAYGGNGECGCAHFQYRIGKSLPRLNRSFPRRCKHILAAREFVLDTLIARYNDEQKQGQKQIRK